MHSPVDQFHGFPTKIEVEALIGKTFLKECVEEAIYVRKSILETIPGKAAVALSAAVSEDCIPIDLILFVAIKKIREQLNGN